MSSVFKTATSEYDLAKIPAAASLEEFSKVTTDWGTALSDYTCFTKELMTPVPLPAGRTVLDVFRLCFDDETTVLEAYHRDRKDTAQKVERWRATTDGQAFRGQREYTCTTLVKAMMGKACPYTEYQRYAFLATPAGSGGGGGDGAARVPTLLVQFSSQISGVMFSDAFRAEALVVFTQAGEGDAAQVTMRAFGYVQFLRSVWVKGKISSRTLEQELPEAYRTLADMIVAELQGGEAAATTGEVVKEVGDDDAAAAAAAVEEKQPQLPQPQQLLPPPLRPQTERERRALLYSSLALAALALLLCLRGALLVLFSRRGKKQQQQQQHAHGSSTGAVAGMVLQSVAELVSSGVNQSLEQPCWSSSAAATTAATSAALSAVGDDLLRTLRAPLVALHLLAAVSLLGAIGHLLQQL